MKKNIGIRIAITCLLAVLAVLSVTVLGKYLSVPSAYQSTLTELEEKEANVLKLSAAAAGTSALITLIPDDVGTPIADQVAEVGSYGLIVICAIYAEKFLLPLTGLVAFKILIPAACALLAIYFWTKGEGWKNVALKVLIFAVATVLIIPVSLKVSSMIEGMYQDSINETIATAEKAQGEMGTVKEVTQEMKGVVNRFIQAIAIMIVTSCVIPVLVLLFFWWIVKLLFGIDLRGSGRDRRRNLPAENAA